MASRRLKLISVAAIAAAAAGGYFLYGLFAAQGQGVLAQAPLNTQVQVPAAFIMALDDSGSMNWETMNNTRDGVFAWRDGSFFNSSYVPWGYGDVNSDASRYLMLFPYPGRNNYQNSVPPLDIYGFARSPDFNPAYFDPTVTYEPWKTFDGQVYAAVDPEAAPVDPRPSGVNNKINRTFDLTNPVREHGDNSEWGFRVQNGMVLPRNLWYYRPNSNYCGNIPGPSREWRRLDSDVFVSNVTSSGSAITGNNCRLGIEYFPATFYLKRSAGAPVPTVAGYTATPERIYYAHGLAPGEELYKFEIRPGNYAAGAYEPAIQNFANWFTYYRTRREALVSGLTNALLDVNSLRIGWFPINNRFNVTMRDMSDDAAGGGKALLYQDFFRLSADGGTPSRQAVRHLGEQFKRSSGNDLPIELTCQKNAGMLFTDGYINDGASPGGYGNVDQDMGSPFADGVSNTMADIAASYYLNSLRPDIEGNNVPVPAGCDVANPDPRLDCQTNLHMNFYGVTLGTLGDKYGVDYQPVPATPWVVTPDPYGTPPAWHNARVDLSPHAVDEMWHATMNARGEMINATTPAAITAAMRRILQSVSGGASPSGTIAITGARIGAGSLTVTPDYEARNEGTDWFSTLTAERVSVDSETGLATFDHFWNASFPAAGSRTVFFTKDGEQHRFRATDLTLEDLCDKPAALYPGMSRCTAVEIEALGEGVDIGDAVDYLLGDVSLEKDNGGPFRERSSVLGDIVNSTPVISSPIDDYGYRSLGTYGGVNYGSTYDTYITSTKASRRYMVYAGANDGMLHAFDGGMNASGDPAGSGGREVFAYIPATALGHMGNLLFPYDPANLGNQKFDHRYYVDGPVTVSDAYDGGWKTVLVGTSGAGGRSVFALDVSDPDGFSASSHLWEISDLDASLPLGVRQNIGHVLGKPVIVPVKAAGSAAPRWKAIFGNGYNSASGKAVLFVVDISGGTPDITMIEAQESSGTIAGSNGIGNIVVVDRWGGTELTTPMRDGFADTVYAADQKGALWKFDLRDLDDYGGAGPHVTTPLFVTQTHTEDGDTYRQPITGGLTAAAGPAGGVMVYFGTGSFSFLDDPRDTRRQSLYAIIDRERGATSATVALNSLAHYTVGAADATGQRTITREDELLLPSGWYVDLGESNGERMVGYPNIAAGVVFFPTYTPEADVSDGCSAGGNNALFGLNARTGAAALGRVRSGGINNPPIGGDAASTTLTGTGTAPVKDVGVMVLPRLAPPGLPTGGGSPGGPGAPPDPPDQGCWMLVTVAGAPPMYLPYPCGRQSWRQIQ